RPEVEDLLNAVVHSVEAVLRDRDGERRQLLVLLRDRAGGEHALAEVAVRGVDLHGGLGHQAVDPFLFCVALVDVHRQSFQPFGVVISFARDSASARRANSTRTRHCWTSTASCVNGSLNHCVFVSPFSAAKPSVGESAWSFSSRSSGGRPEARSRATTAARTAAFQIPVRP